MKELSILRASYSPYFKPSFKKLEQQELSKFGQFQFDGKSSPDILITNTETNLLELKDKKILETTKLIIHPNSGYDNFLNGFIENTDIPVIIGNTIRQEAVVNYCISCLFDHTQKIPWQTSWESRRYWDRPQLSSKKALIIGHGHVGEMLEKRLNLFLEKTYIHDPKKDLYALHQKAEVDYIFICAELNESTHHLIDQHFLNELKPDATIINPARGKIIQLQDLISHLEQYPKSFAYLDVFPHEPYELESLGALKNLKASCHVAGVFDKIDDEIINFESRVISDFSELNINEFLEKYRNLHLQHKLGIK